MRTRLSLLQLEAREMPTATTMEQPFPTIDDASDVPTLLNPVDTGVLAADDLALLNAAVEANVGPLDESGRLRGIFPGAFPPQVPAPRFPPTGQDLIDELRSFLNKPEFHPNELQDLLVIYIKLQQIAQGQGVDPVTGLTPEDAQSMLRYIRSAFGRAAAGSNSIPERTQPGTAPSPGGVFILPNLPAPSAERQAELRALLAGLLPRLDSNSFKEREAAQRELRDLINSLNLGDLAFLQQELLAAYRRPGVSPEEQRRIVTALEQLNRRAGDLLMAYYYIRGIGSGAIPLGVS